jgi:DNA helicase-2/ATP-dependent DNA helicase PcrA
MRKPTECQQRILDNPARLRVVQAVPGSGKTWLIGEVIRREYENWNRAHQGIAALSFTNVAGEEIRRALGRSLEHPHFVGTIDAFVYRYIVRPFVRWFRPGMAPPRLIPAEVVDNLAEKQQWWRKNLIHTVDRGEKSLRDNLFRFHLTAEDVGGSPLAIIDQRWKRHHLLVSESQALVKAKKEIWRKSGRLSHSDCAYIAASMLADPEKGTKLRDLLVHRFPFIVVDELQDTGHFLCQGLLRLLEPRGVRGLIVGDPDQAIYGFNGAKPSVFEDFERLPGAEPCTMSITQRCGAAVCGAASLLSHSKRTIIPDEQIAAGRAILVVHDGDPKPLYHLATQIREAVPSAEHKVALVTRRNREVFHILGRDGGTVPSFKSRPITSLYHAVRHLQQGRMTAAFSAAQAALGRSLLGTEMPTTDDLAELSIDAAEWRRAVAELVWIAREVPPTPETAFEWGCRMREAVEQISRERDWWERCQARAPKRPAKETRGVTRSEIQRGARGDHGRTVLVQTVHAIKGETHHTTIYFVPGARKKKDCPSRTWWSKDPDLAEERRIAFVAATRPRHTFVLSLHRSTYEAIRERRPTFLTPFVVHEEVPLHASLLDVAPVVCDMATPGAITEADDDIVVVPLP